MWISAFGGGLFLMLGTTKTSELNYIYELLPAVIGINMLEA